MKKHFLTPRGKVIDPRCYFNGSLSRTAQIGALPKVSRTGKIQINLAWREKENHWLRNLRTAGQSDISQYGDISGYLPIFTLLVTDSCANRFLTFSSWGHGHPVPRHDRMT